MNKLFTKNHLLGLAVLLFSTIFSINNANAQCVMGSNDGALSFTCNTTQSVTVNQGNQRSFSVVTGIVYEFTTVGTNYDTRIYANSAAGGGGTLYFDQDADNSATPVAGNEIASWASTVTSTIYVGIHGFSCAGWNGTSATLNYRQTSTVSNTTSTAAICSNSTKALSYTVSSGTAVPTWSIVSGGGSIVGTGNSAVYTPATSGSKTIRATLGVCTSDVTFTVDALPGAASNTTSNAGICGNGTTRALTGTPAGGTFSLVSGPGSVSGTTYTATGSGTALIRYTIAASGSCPATTSDVSIAVTLDPGAASNTTSTAAMCGNGSTRPLTGTPAGGTFSLFSGTGSVASSTYTAPTLGSTTAVVRYTIAASGSCAATTSNVSIPVDQNPVISNPAAVCDNSTATVSATIGTISFNIAPTSYSGTTYTPHNLSPPTQNQNVTITATNGVCTPTATIRVDNLPTISNPTAVCDNSTATVTQDVTGTIQTATAGTWVGGTFTPPNLTPPLQNQNITLTATNGACAPTASIRADNNTTATAGFAGPDQTKCNDPNFILAANNTAAEVTGSTGLWTCTSGCGASWGSTSVYNTTYGAVTANTTSVIRWTTTNGVCTNFDEVSLRNDAQPSISGTAALCDLDGSALFSNSGGFSVNWSIPSGGSVSPASGTSTTLTMSDITPPTQNITPILTATNGLCTATLPLTISNATLFTSSSGSLCVGQTRTLTANVTGTTFSGAGGAASGTFTAPDPSPSVSANYNIFANNGPITCRDQQTITVYSVATFTSSSADMCQGQTRTLAATPVSGLFSCPAYPSAVSGFTFTAPTPATAFEDIEIRYQFLGSPCYSSQFIRVYRNPTTATIAVSPLYGCGTLTSPALGGNTPAFGTGTWTQFSGPGTSGFSSINSGASTATVSITGSYVFTWTIANGACASSSANVTVDFVNNPSAPTSGGNQEVCFGLTVPNLTASVGGGETVDWYANPSGGSPVAGGTGTTSFATGQTAVNVYTYYAETRNTTTGCVSTTRTAVTLTIKALPSAPTSGGNQSVCFGLTVPNLTASAGGGEVVDWYANPSGGGSLFTGTSFATGQTAVGVYTYYAEARNTTTTCVSGTRTPVTLTISILPSAPTAGNEVGCQSYTIPNITASVGGGETVDWYANASGGLPLASGSTSFATGQTAPATYTYYAEARNTTTGCLSATRTAVTLTINPKANIAAGPDLQTCVSTPVSVPGGNASASNFGTFYVWSVGVGNGSIASEATLTPTYTPDPSDAGTTVVLDFTTDDPDGAGPCPAETDALNIVVDAFPTTANAGPDIFDCATDLVETMAGNNPSIGTGVWSGTATFAPGNTNNSTATVAAVGTYTFTWTITNGLCPPSADNVNVSYSNPLPITTLNGATGACVINDNDWHHIFDANNNVIMSINSNGQNLGSVSTTVYIGSPSQVPNNNNNLGCFNQTSFSAYMGRHFDIVPTNAPSSGVNVRLYFTSAELSALEAAALANNDGDLCDDDDDVAGIGSIGVSKYPTGSGPGGTGVFIAQSGNGVAFSANYIQFSTSSFSSVFLHANSNNAPLPVELINFTATAINNEYIRLDWATALEVNNDGFVIERSTDAQSWSAIGWVDGNDNSTSTILYDYSDMQVTSNVVYYYRLKQMDNDGAFEYSNVVSASLNGGGTFDVLDFVPNPTVDQTTLLVTSGVPQDIKVTIYNAIGQEVQTGNHTLTVGMNQIKFDVNLLAAGTYMATVTSGNEIRTKRLVIGR